MHQVYMFGDPGINPLFQHRFMASTVPGKSERGVKPCDVFTAEKVDAAHENGLITQRAEGSDSKLQENEDGEIQANQDTLQNIKKNLATCF